MRLDDLLQKLRPDHPIHWIHPWDLASSCAGTDALTVAVIDRAFHEQFPWTDKRWAFVLAGINQCSAVIIADSNQPELLADCIRNRGHNNVTLETLNPGYETLFEYARIHKRPNPGILPVPSRFCRSFSKFYRLGTQATGDLFSALNRDTL